jgi:hypothetical protein
LARLEHAASTHGAASRHDPPTSRATMVKVGSQNGSAAELRIRTLERGRGLLYQLAADDLEPGVPEGPQILGRRELGGRGAHPFFRIIQGACRTNRRFGGRLGSDPDDGLQGSRPPPSLCPRQRRDESSRPFSARPRGPTRRHSGAWPGADPVRYTHGHRSPPCAGWTGSDVAVASASRALVRRRGGRRRTAAGASQAERCPRPPATHGCSRAAADPSTPSRDDDASCRFSSA